MSTAVNDIKNVVEGGYCVGCGACAFITKSKMEINSYGEYIPNLLDIQNNSNGHNENKIISACPTLQPELNENFLSQMFIKGAVRHNSFLGDIQGSYAAYAKEGAFRENGTSGGMGTWIATELLNQKLIDGVIHVKKAVRNKYDDPFYVYGISTNVDEIKESSKTRYHVVEISQVLELVLKSPGKYLFIGVPCMSKAIRRLQLLDPILSERIPFIMSLVCGHLKSINWSLSLAWGVGINPRDSKEIQYRTKGIGIPARAYVFRAHSSSDIIQQNSAEVVGGKYNSGALMLSACDYCDDVVGETADLTIGDAWIPKFEVDNGGTNLLIVRNSVIYEILKSASDSDRIMFTQISDELAVESQSGGFRQRREGLSYRLSREIKKGRWVPTKRVLPGQYSITSLRKKVYDSRSSVSLKSRELFKQALLMNDYSIYSNGLSVELKQLRALEIRSSFFRLATNKLKRIFLSFLKK